MHRLLSFNLILFSVSDDSFFLVFSKMTRDMLPEENVIYLFRSADRNNTGEVDIHEFIGYGVFFIGDLVL